MCPACIGSALLLLSGAGSAGGAAAVMLRSLTNRSRDPASRTQRGPNREPSRRALWRRSISA